MRWPWEITPWLFSLVFSSARYFHLPIQYLEGNSEITIAIQLLLNSFLYRLGNCLRQSLLILVHPISMLFFSTVIDTYRMFPEDLSDPLQLIGKSYTASQRALIFSIVDETLYGHWLFPLSTCLYLPLWSITWANLSNCSH